MGFSQLGFYPRQSKSFYAGSLKKHPKGIGVFYYNTSSPKNGGGVFNNFFLLGITWTVFFFQGVMEFPVGEMFHCVVRDDNNSGVTHTWNSKQPFFKRMFGETTIFHVKVWNHPIETTTKKWLFQVPGI